MRTCVTAVTGTAKERGRKRAHYRPLEIVDTEGCRIWILEEDVRRLIRVVGGTLGGVCRDDECVYGCEGGERKRRAGETEAEAGPRRGRSWGMSGSQNKIDGPRGRGRRFGWKSGKSKIHTSDGKEDGGLASGYRRGEGDAGLGQRARLDHARPAGGSHQCSENGRRGERDGRRGLDAGHVLERERCRGYTVEEAAGAAAACAGIGPKEERDRSYPTVTLSRTEGPRGQGVAGDFLRRGFGLR